ncbi:MAG TPA: hypothetical protein VM680_16780 [Verrucomicrobiae bacterium]|nr:hypothetical protein [Verrucomicrobiae bacterium]
MNRIFLCTTLSLAATPLAIQAADVPENPNRFSLGARFGMNIKASFRSAGSAGGTAANPGPATAGADHNYDDGYVRVDSSGTATGTTWNWGYQNSSQVVGDTLQFHAADSASGASDNDITDDPQLGLELIYQRFIGSFSSAGHWGLEAGFGYTDLDLRASNAAGRTMITDSFALNGVLPPAAGYNGTFAGPGPVISDTPTRTVETLTGGEELTGQMFSIRLGPFVEWNFTPQLSLSGSAGITLAPASFDYDFSETSSSGTTIAGHSSKSDLLYGPYVSAMLHYEFTESWGAYVGAQFQSLTDLEQSVGSHTARLDQGATIYATAGLSFRF